METLLSILPYLLNVASGIVLAICTYTINKARDDRRSEKEKANEKDQALSDGVQALLRESIVTAYNKYSDKGFCPIYAKESLKKAYKSYAALGGNDVATGLYHKLLAMPEIKEDEHE